MMLTEIDRVAATTTFNNQKLFSGSDFGSFSGSGTPTSPPNSRPGLRVM